MGKFRIEGVSAAISEEVRRTGASPDFGHPVVSETATGTGPCRSCLKLFEVGGEDRLLFTYRPDSGQATVGAPGPVYIHQRECERWEADHLPEDLLGLELLAEGRRRDGTVVVSRATAGVDAPGIVEAILDQETVDFVFLRHGDAGCHIARVDRA